MMKSNRQSPMLAVFALALGMSVGAMAQTGAAGTAGSANDGAQGGGNTASSMTFQNWLNAHSGKRITRQEYMDEVSRRWDTADASRQGLTTDEIARMYWHPGVGMGGPTATQPQQKEGIQK
jgi:hypothetical protein